MASDTDADEQGLGRFRRMVFCGVVGLVCAALIGLIWVATFHAIHDQRAEVMQRGKAWVEAQSNLLTEAARRELGSIDQSLLMLQQAASKDPKEFDISAWQASVPGLSEVTDEVFIANANHVIVQDNLPQAVGEGIGGIYASTGRGQLERILPDGQTSRDNNMMLTALAEHGAVRRYLMYLVRPMPEHPGWLVGASYRSSALVKVFAQGSLGVRGLAALLDTRRGGVQAVAGPAALHPKLNVADTAMWKHFQSTGYSGEWVGPTGMDGVDRIQAYHRVPGRDLVAVVGLDLNDWLAPTESWAQSVRMLAGLGTLLVLGIGGLVLWWLWSLESNRRLRHMLHLTQQKLRTGHADGGHTLAPAGAAQMRSVLESYSDGVALLGTDGRLLAWNPSFASASRLPPDALHRGLPVTEVLRPQEETARQVPATTPGESGAEPPAIEQAQAGDQNEIPLTPPARPDHLVERVAERLLRSGALEGSSANLLGRAATRSGGDMIERGGQSVDLPGLRGTPPAEPLPAPPVVDVIGLERAGMVDWSRTRSRVSEEFRLAQRQLLSTAFNNPQAQAGFSNLVMVTSARPGEGKSFMAMNLAGSIARQGDHSVLLIDADSKRDSFCYPLGLADSPGLLDLAANPRLDASQCIVQTPIERLSVLPVGRERERGPELFASKEMGRLIQSLGRRYADRLVILDAPPCLSTSDPAVLASVVGQVLMVVQAEQTQRDEVEAALDLVQACPNIFMVLNKQRVASRFNFGAYSSYYSS